MFIWELTALESVANPQLLRFTERKTKNPIKSIDGDNIANEWGLGWVSRSLISSLDPFFLPPSSKEKHTILRVGIRGDHYIFNPLLTGDSINFPVPQFPLC